MSKPIDIIWNTGIDPSGYSSCARSYIKALHGNDGANIRVRINKVANLINSKGIDVEDLSFFSSISTNSSRSDNFVNHSVPDRMIFTPGRSILYTVVEMGIPKRWVKICNKCDILMTASNFCKDIMVKEGIREEIINVVPHCHDSYIWNPCVSPLNILNLKGYNFLFVGDYTPRKNGDMLVESFIREFEGNKDVSLTIKGYYNSFDVGDQKRLIDRIRKVADSTGIPLHRRPSVFFYGEPICESIMPNFMNTFDCLVSPHRGEGWGLSLSQMQFLGKPVISTNYSGNLDFMNEDISYLIDVDGFEPVCEEMVKINPNFKGQDWIRLRSDSLQYLMREVYNNQKEAKEKGSLAREYMVENFSYEKVSNQIIEILKG